MANPRARLDAAMAHHRRGEIAEAAALYREILEEWPDDPDALHLLGLIAFQRGNVTLALQLIEAALTTNPRHGAALTNYAVFLHKEGRMAEALRAARDAVKYEPKNAEALAALANVLLTQGDTRNAVVHYRQAAARAPQNADIHNALAVAEMQDGQIAAAWVSVQTALGLQPDAAHIHNTRGNILRAAGWPDRAAEAFRRAAELDPTFKDAQVSTAMALMTSGDLARGLDLYEARGMVEERYQDLPFWDGKDLLPAQKLLVRAEQGFGDTFQFIRYVPELLVKHGNCLIEVQDELLALVQRMLPQAQVVGRNTPLPACDQQIRLISLSRFCETGVTIPYLEADAAKLARWEDKLASVKAPRIGLVWSGNPKHFNDRNRSIDFARLGNFCARYAPHLVALQKGQRAEDLQTAPGIFDAGKDCADFDDTAACISCLDLVVTVDTAVAHLAGALGKPVWLLLPFDPDWRWMMERKDTPYYPAMRLFRQAGPRDWKNVLDSLQRETGRLTAGDLTVLRPTPWQGSPAPHAAAALPLEEGTSFTPNG